MEILDLYDDAGVSLEKTIERGTITNSGENIMLAVAFIKNKEDLYLIQKTSKEKGGRYSSTGGHVIHNELPIDTIKRELQEELGINVNANDLKHIGTFKYPSKNCIFNVYLLNLDIPISKIALQTEEVEKVEYLSASEITNIIDSGNFLESHAYIFNNYIKEQK